MNAYDGEELKPQHMCVETRGQLCGVSPLHPSVFAPGIKLRSKASKCLYQLSHHRPSVILPLGSENIARAVPSCHAVHHFLAVHFLNLGNDHKWLHNRLFYIIVDYNGKHYFTVSVEEEFKSSLAGWFWLQSHDAAVKMSRGLQSSEDWLGLRVTCLLNTLALL